jgi:hypothetical protein
MTSPRRKAEPARGNAEKSTCPRARKLKAFLIGVGLANLQLAGNCVDGVTPDCGDGSACSPVTTLDASDALLGDASPDGPSSDAASDASDASDGG